MGNRGLRLLLPSGPDGDLMVQGVAGTAPHPAVLWLCPLVPRPSLSGHRGPRPPHRTSPGLWKALCSSVLQVAGHFEAHGCDGSLEVASASGRVPSCPGRKQRPLRGKQTVSGERWLPPEERQDRQVGNEALIPSIGPGSASFPTGQRNRHRERRKRPTPRPPGWGACDLCPRRAGRCWR